MTARYLKSLQALNEKGLIADRAAVWATFVSQVAYLSRLTKYGGTKAFPLRKPSRTSTEVLLAAVHEDFNIAATCSAVALADMGFCPVTSLPSTTTFETKGSHAFS